MIGNSIKDTAQSYAACERTSLSKVILYLSETLTEIPKLKKVAMYCGRGLMQVHLFLREGSDIFYYSLQSGFSASFSCTTFYGFYTFLRDESSARSCALHPIISTEQALWY